MDKDTVIERAVRDFEHKAESLYNKGFKEGFTSGKDAGFASVWGLVKELKDRGILDKVLEEDLDDIEDIISRCGTDKIIDIFDTDSGIETGDVVEDFNGLRAVVMNTDTYYHLVYLDSFKTWKAPKNTDLKKTGDKINVNVLFNLNLRERNND